MPPHPALSPRPFNFGIFSVSSPARSHSIDQWFSEGMHDWVVAPQYLGVGLTLGKKSFLIYKTVVHHGNF